MTAPKQAQTGLYVQNQENAAPIVKAAMITNVDSATQVDIAVCNVNAAWSAASNVQYVAAGDPAPTGKDDKFFQEN